MIMTANDIEIVLCSSSSPDRELSLFFSPFDTPIARRYVDALRECAVKGFPIKDPDRFYNFPGTHKNAAWIVGELNRCIAEINQKGKDVIPHRANVQMEQALLNLLHSYFEKLRGSVLKPSPFYEEATPSTKRAIDDLNLLIHRYEDFQRSEIRAAKRLRPFAQAVLTFAGPVPRYPLHDEDYIHFNRKVVFGSLYINYCELGKPIWDVFKDKDEFVGDSNIRPLKYYSADTFLNFSPSHEITDRLRQTVEWLRFRRWWGQNSSKLAELGYTWNDPKNSIGNITVALLNRSRGEIEGHSEGEIVALIGNHQCFKRIAVR